MWWYLPKESSLDLEELALELDGDSATRSNGNNQPVKPLFDC
jgi:hypothetical protein